MDNGNLNNGEVMSQLKQQIAMAHVQQMLSKMTSRCFNKCITKPGRALDGTEQRCITQCMDRFMDTWDHVSRTYGNRIQREQAKGFQNVSTLN